MTGLEYALTYLLEPYVGPDAARLLANGIVSSLDLAMNTRNKAVNDSCNNVINNKPDTNNENNVLANLKDMIKNGDKIDEKNIAYKLDDNTKIIFRLDTGANAHKIPGYSTPVDHINIEIQYLTKNHNKRVLLDLHIVLDEDGNVIDTIFTGDRK